MKAICYIRVSTEDQVNYGISLEAQEEKLRNYCRLQKLEPVIVIDRVSAGKPLVKRTGGKRMSELIDTGVSHVVAFKLDRLFRDALDALNWLREWEKFGVTLHLLDVGGAIISSQGAMGKFFLHLLAGFAELERGLISERTVLALRHKKDSHRVYGPIPYGFDRKGNQLIRNKFEVAIIKRIRSFREKGESYAFIANQFMSEGIPTKKGKRWHASTIERIFKNDITGDF